MPTQHQTDRLDELLLRWQEAHRPSAEEVCADCPELIADLRERIRAFEAMEGALGLGRETPTTGPASTPDQPVAGTGGQPAAVPVLPGYEVLGVLDQGGMGVVYKARQVALDRPVAVKMILAGPHARAEQVQRFRTEAEAVARLRHPHVVQIYEVGEQDGRPFFSMEYVEGGSLAQKLAKGPLPARQAAQLVATLAEAVQAAHDHGILHRDLKPGNILLQARGSQPVGLETPKVADFGLAKRLASPGDHQTETGAVLGTPSYLAPEQAAGKTKEIGPAADVYALGAILYECLTGRPPFQGESALDTLEQVRSREPVPPARLQPKVPRDLDTICLKCLQKEPRKRYASAQELADDLRRFLAGETIRARPAPLWEKGARWARRKPAAAALWAVSAAAAAALLGVWAGFTAELRAERDHARQEQQRVQEEERRARREEQRALEQERLAGVAQQTAQQERDAAHAQRERAQAILGLSLNAIDEHAKIIEIGKGEWRVTGEPGSILYQLARSYAAASGTYREGDDSASSRLAPEDRRKLAEQYADRAVKLLEKAWLARYFEKAANLEKLKADKDFDPLRSRPDFRQLLGRVEGKRT